LLAGSAYAAIPEHLAITSYEGPQTCIACHPSAGTDMLNSLHMQWKGATPELINTNGESLGKAVGGINTFCTYAMSSKGACFNCHLRLDGNAPHAPSVNDIDCLMCHNDTYQRKFVADPNNAETVVDWTGVTRTFIFGLMDIDGNYVTEPDYANMPPGTTMVQLAQNVHKPTRQSCLRCHAKAGGGDWTKRGDMGMSTAAPTVAQDVHMSPDVGGANLTCASCHAEAGHKIGGRGIDLRETEAADPKCTDCHSSAPHSNADYNRHATNGRVSCQACHIRTYAKGGSTEMSRNWLNPVWNPTFCNGQGGWIGEELRASNVKPEYRWFDGTSYVYNIGETILPSADGTYTMARANGRIFDGVSKIVPIKNHRTVMPLHQSGVLIPPAIYWMFMTGDFDQAVQKGMEDQGLTGSYTMVNANAEMLITHGVDPASSAPTCSECHSYTGETADGTKMVPFTQLGYHVWPTKVKSCTLCHEQKSLSWRDMHLKHAEEMGKNCQGCHTTEPTGWIEPPTPSGLCNNCHSGRTYSSAQDLHKEHAEAEHGGMRTTCTDCHTF
nr:hypothetical protein [Desulfobacteraceae bacterium]